MRRTNFPGVLRLTAVILVGLSGIYSAAETETITVHMERGQQHYQAGDYEAALKEFRTVTEIDPGYIRGWENMCWTYCKMGRTDKALDIWESLKAVHPDRTKLLNVIGDAYAAKEEYEQALNAYEESLETKPGQVEILAARCRVLYWAGRNEEAFVCCREFLSTHPEQDEIRQILAKLQMSQQIGDYQAAINNWQYLIQKRPDDLQLRIELAKAYYRNESNLEAYETAQNIVKRDSKNVTVLDILINTSIQLQKYERAHEVIGELESVDPNNPDITVLQARIYDGVAQQFFREGDYNKALEKFLLVKTLAPELPGLLENIGWTYRRLGRIDEALNIWEQLLDNQPDNVRMLNLVAGAYADKEMYDKALLMYERSLKVSPDQEEIRFSIARIKRWIGRFQESADELSRLIVKYPQDAPMRYQLALCLMRFERYDEAIEQFKELSLTNPDESQYVMGMAEALYLSGQRQEALKIANDVLAKDPWNLEALDFLTDDADFFGDYKKACQLLESAVTIDGNDVTRLNRLADCAANIDDYPVVERATERSLKLLASQPGVRMLYADSLRINGSVDKAMKQYRIVLSCNPNHIPALIGLKECCIIKEDFEKGLEYLDRALSIDKTNFYFTLEKSKLLAYTGEYDKSVDIMEDLLERSKNQETILVLLYHGVAKSQKSGTMRLSSFKAQMEVLKELGYSAVTIDDLFSAWKGGKKLPRKSVLITFDDARRDSFECAGPILKEFSFKATMFVPVCIVESQDPVYCNWQQLEHYASNGLWDIQSHGNNAHNDIVIDSSGRHGTFQTHRQWLDNKNRLENDLEFHQRIETDYRQSREILENRLNKKVNAFAFPKGWYGQEECTDTETVASNLATVNKYFAFSFVQDKHGLNLVGDNRYLLKRLEVHETWTAQQLHDHISENDPVKLVNLNLAKIYRWAGKNKQALYVYDELLKDNPLDRDIMLGKVKACMGRGRFTEARLVLEQILELDSTDQDALEQQEKLDQLTTPAVDSFFSCFKDDNQRERFKWGAYLHLPYNDELSIEPSWARARLKEKNIKTVYENEYSLSAVYRRDETRCDFSYIFRDFSGANDYHNYSLIAGMPLFFDDVTFVHAYRSIETARAAIKGIRHYENSISIRQAVNGRLTSYFRYRHDDYTDRNWRHSEKNWRNSFKLTGLYRILNLPKVFVGCEFVYDDTNFFSPFYYTPDELQIVRAILKTNGRLLDDLKYNLRYAVGYAQENGNGDEIVHDGSASLDYQTSDSLELGMLITFSNTPTYGSEYINVNLKYRF